MQLHVEGDRSAHSGALHLPLDSRLRRIVFAAIICVAAVLYVGRIGSWMYANWLIRKNPPNYTRALEWEPNNPALRSLAGMAKFSDGDWEEALVHLKAATQQTPYDARHWLDLAMVYQVMDRVDEQDYALRRAVAVDPRTPQVAWEVGNFELARDHGDAALAQFRTVIASDPFLAWSAISTVWRFTHSYDAVASVLPAKMKPWEDFLGMMITANEPENARRAWESMVGLHQEIAATAAVNFTNYLLQSHEYARAETAWRQFTASSKFSGHARTDNLVINGGFDEDVLNGGFDWRFVATPDMEISLDAGSAHDGSRALLISFEENSSGDPQLFQYVPVQPNTNYEFTAYVRGEEIYTTNGPRAMISDAKSGAVYFASAPLIGTTAWTQVEQRFQTSSDTHLLKVGISRVPTLIRGRVWVDEVSLVQK
jgi:tetratricopeptide (TPR) repeat protein